MNRALGWSLSLWRRDRQAISTLLLSAALAIGVGASSGVHSPPPARTAVLPSLGAAAMPPPAPIVDDATRLIATGNDAVLRNADRPSYVGGVEFPPPFRASGRSEDTLDRAQNCLALAMYYEAGFEGQGGRMAVGQVVLNRVRHPAFPHDVCGVVFQRSKDHVCQFTFACDGAMRRVPVPSLFQKARLEAADLLSGKTYAPVGMATHYHANYVLPYWAPNLDKIATVGAHVFYRWSGGWGRRRAFTALYAGLEEGIVPSVGTEGIGGDCCGSPAKPELVSEVAPRRSANEGGFVDPAVGWIPNISRTAAAADAEGAPP